MKRKYLKFSVRTGLIAVALLSLVIGVWSYRARRQAYYVRKLYEDGADVVAYKPEKWWWLGKVLPQDFYTSPVYVHFNIDKEFYSRDANDTSYPVTQAQIDAIKNLPSVTAIYLDNSDINDQRIDFIYDMPHVESLGLRNTNVTYEKCQEIQKRFPDMLIYYE